MREVLHNIMTRRNWFLGALVVVFLIYFLIDPNSVFQMANGLWQLIKLAGVFAVAIVGIRMILGYKPFWWPAGSGGGKKK